jgi:hypothetical protein
MVPTTARIPLLSTPFPFSVQLALACLKWVSRLPKMAIRLLWCSATWFMSCVSCISGLSYCGGDARDGFCAKGVMSIPKLCCCGGAVLVVFGVFGAGVFGGADAVGVGAGVGTGVGTGVGAGVADVGVITDEDGADDDDGAGVGVGVGIEFFLGLDSLGGSGASSSGKSMPPKASLALRGITIK